MSNVLDQILARTRVTVDERRRALDRAALERQAAAHTPRGFAASLRRTAAHHPAIIAELKKASPSKGILRADYRPAEVALAYEHGGAAAISVLTDEPFFQGSLDHLREVSAAVRIPVLRKDFMVDSFQMLEARAAGADAVLLIVAAHDDATLRLLAQAAHELELDILTEVHNRAELDRAIDLGAEILGVNCRDLTSMQMIASAHEDLVAAIPSGVLRVAESGVQTHADIARLSAAGYNAFLVGETLMRHSDPGAMLETLMTGR